MDSLRLFSVFGTPWWFVLQVQELVLPDRYLGVDHLYDLDIALMVLTQSVVTDPNIMPACVDWGVTMEPKHNDIGYVSSFWQQPTDHYSLLSKIKGYLLVMVLFTTFLYLTSNYMFTKSWVIQSTDFKF